MSRDRPTSKRKSISNGSNRHSDLNAAIRKRGLDYRRFRNSQRARDSSGYLEQLELIIQSKEKVEIVLRALSASFLMTQRTCLLTFNKKHIKKMIASCLNSNFAKSQHGEIWQEVS